MMRMGLCISRSTGRADSPKKHSKAVLCSGKALWSDAVRHRNEDSEDGLRENRPRNFFVKESEDFWVNWQDRHRAKSGAQEDVL